jgi:hypothetical protein
MTGVSDANRHNEKCEQDLIGNSGGKRHLRRQRHRWEENVQMDLNQIRNETMEWIQLSQIRIP